MKRLESQGGDAPASPEKKKRNRGAVAVAVGALALAFATAGVTIHAKANYKPATAEQYAQWAKEDQDRDATRKRQEREHDAARKRKIDKEIDSQAAKNRREREWIPDAAVSAEERVVALADTALGLVDSSLASKSSVFEAFTLSDSQPYPLSGTKEREVIARKLDFFGDKLCTGVRVTDVDADDAVNNSDTLIDAEVCYEDGELDSVRVSHTVADAPTTLTYSRYEDDTWGVSSENSSYYTYESDPAAHLVFEDFQQSADDALATTAETVVERK